MAIGMHMDRGAASQPRSSNHIEPEPEIRAPIPQKHEVLVEEQRVYGFRRHKRKINSSVFDGFRDFQAEINQQENDQAASTSRASKCRRLEDLFRPPIDLIFKGSFHSARDSGAQQNRWLMVNIQNVQEFPCQVLNRDLWSNHAVRHLVMQSFLLWQVYHDSEEGRKYVQFYPVPSWPYIAIIDPRTGEKMVEWKKMDAMSFCDLVGDFLTRHPNPNGITTPSPPSKRQKRQESIIDTCEASQLEVAMAASVQEGVQERPVDVQTARQLVLESDSDDCYLTDDAELETFSGSDEDSNSPVKYSQSPKLEKQVASLRQNTVSVANEENSQPENRKEESDSKPVSESDHSEEETISTPHAETLKDTWRHFLGDENGEQSTVLLKLPDGQREQLQLPATSQLRALTEYMREKGFCPDKYELMTHYPRKNLSGMEPATSLKTAGLFPQETVFVHERS